MPKQWKSWLALAELWYNSNYHSSLGCSPFKALYGYDAELGTMLPTTAASSSSASNFLQHRETQIAAPKTHLAAAQNWMKLQADRSRSDRTFQVGEQVLLKLQPYVQQSVVSRPYPKLAYKFFGPFTVIEKIGAVAYRLDLPSHSLIHPVFHVSQLKPFTPNYSPVYTELPKLVDLSSQDLQPEHVLDRRLVKKGSQAVPQVLVKWSHLPEASATWEDLYVVKAHFPDAVAWGQATSSDGGGVTSTVEKAGNAQGAIDVCFM